MQTEEKTLNDEAKKLVLQRRNIRTADLNFKAQIFAGCKFSFYFRGQTCFHKNTSCEKISHYTVSLWMLFVDITILTLHCFNLIKLLLGHKLYGLICGGILYYCSKQHTPLSGQLPFRMLQFLHHCFSGNKLLHSDSRWHNFYSSNMCIEGQL